MSVFSPQDLQNALYLLGAPEAASYCVAYSGGLDSTVLLHAVARMTRAGGRGMVRALHVDHQLQADSARWSAHCASVAAALGVAFVEKRVLVEPSKEGLEAAARRARYQAFREVLEPDEILLTAHHADDQLETVLLALVRGAGVRGLSGIVAGQRFGRGWLMRPLLGYARSQLDAWARAEGLHWVEDPMNQDVDLDRNYLRSRVLPALRTRWPAAPRSASRAAAHLAEAAQLLESQAREDLEQAAVGDSLNIAVLCALEPARRRNVLRHWIRKRGALAPSTRKLAQIEHSVLAARADRTPCVQWDEVEVRRYRGLLELDVRTAPFDAGQELHWDPARPIELPGRLGRLRLQPDAAGGLDAARLGAALTIRFRRGGERLRAMGAAHHRPLKKLLQERGVPPWRRDRLPLIYCDQSLVAVGDLWVSHEFAVREGGEAARIVWERSA